MIILTHIQSVYRPILDITRVSSLIKELIHERLGGQLKESFQKEMTIIKKRKTIRVYQQNLHCMIRRLRLRLVIQY